MSKSSFPILLAAGAAILLLGGGKKKKAPAPVNGGVVPLPEPGHSEPDIDFEPDQSIIPDLDPGAPPIIGDSIPIEKVSWGIRNDKRGEHVWRIMRDGDAYKAQLLSDQSRFASHETIGVAGDENGARAILRDYYNDLLVKRWPNEKPKIDPMNVLTIVDVSRFSLNK